MLRCVSYPFMTLDNFVAGAPSIGLRLRGLALGGLAIGVTLAMFCVAPACRGAEPTFLEFVREQARSLRAHDATPVDRAAAEKRLAEVRAGLFRAWGGLDVERCDLNPQVLGTLERDSYRLERVVLQTLPGVWMTANAYVPRKPGPHPAVLCVHGHWRGAKQDPVIQSRSIGLVKQGFFVLAVDAFGAGERGLGKALGEYHGEMTGATLFPAGTPLSGIQVYENMRAVDYLKSRPEVDGNKIGVTGASGGGNQSMYAGAWDERLSAAVPVCSVGNYHAYLGAACCMCEVVPGALTFTDEGDVLAMASKRSLMVVSATRDAPQFSVAEARKSLERANPFFALQGRGDALRHTIIESGHDYNRPMREAMYGWMAKHLRGDGDGSPLPEPEIKTEDPEAIRCYPGQSRPDDYVTLPKFAAREARRVLAARPVPDSLDAWKVDRQRRIDRLRADVLGGFPARTKLELVRTPQPDGASWKFVSEPGVMLTATHLPSKQPKTAASRWAVVIDCDGLERATQAPHVDRLRNDGWNVLAVQLRATGSHAVPNDTIGAAPDHNSAEWAMWIGRPLLGQWAWDVQRAIDAIEETTPDMKREVTVHGSGSAALVALVAAALDERVGSVSCRNLLASYVTETPYRGQRLGVIAPGILRHAGDVPELAALVAPRPVEILGGVTGGGERLDESRLTTAFATTRQVFAMTGAADKLSVAVEVARLSEP